MSEQQTPAKKQRTATNVALIGVVFGLLGIFLIWRGSNMGEQSGVGFLLVLAAVAFLITGLIYRIKAKR